MLTLKPFQETAIASLKNEFLSLWKSPNNSIPLVFKSPTGSGKTIMLAQFLRDIVSDPRFQNNDVAFVWFSFSQDSYEQSKKKLFDYYGGASELDLLDLNDLTRGKLNKNNVFFINWQKIKGSTRDSRRLRRDNERGLTFDSFIKKSQEDGRRLVVIIDEEHIGADTELADEVINGVVKPKIVIRVSATPKYEPTREDTDEKKAGFVKVKRDDVVKEGLIKEKIVFQTEEDLRKKDFSGMNKNEILLELAYNKRNELISYYKKLKVDINPLVLVQLPNKDRVNRNTTTDTQAAVERFLKAKNVPEEQVAVWLSDEKENLEEIERDNSSVSFLLFNQAAATGWDCPRAAILVMFKEIQSPTFAIQTVGRILRMPFGVHFPIPELNIGYLYTDYKRNEVLAEYAKSKTENRPAINISNRKPEVKPISLPSVFMSRTDYNDLGDSFQKTFIKIADKHFGFSAEESKQGAAKKLEAKGVAVNPKITTGLIVNVEVDNFDNFTEELRTEGGSHDLEISEYDIENIYNLRCFKLIAEQLDENKKYAPERSWGKLKTALNVWLTQRTDMSRQAMYKTIVHDLLSKTSIFAPVIGKALAEYRPIREHEVNKKSERAKRTESIEIPRETLYYTDQYQVMKVKKAAMMPFYIEKDYLGEENEKEFIAFLESHKKVEWWYKNGDAGSEYFSIAYYNADENREKLFYPDWIVKTKDTVWILETKNGATAELVDTKYKAEALQAWLKGQKGLSGALVVQDGPNGWKANSKPKYAYNKAFTGWESLTEIL